jgi:cytochrome c-type biogenesis protein CcmH
MTPFVLLAGALVLGAALLVGWPLVRRRDGSVPAPWAGAAAAVVVIAGGVGLYLASSNFSWKVTAADSPEAMVSQLARRLERDPDDLEGWLMLGRSQLVLQQYPLALRAFQQADRLAGGKNAEALLGLGEALVMANDAALEGRGGEFFEAALALEPKSGKALFFAAAAALRRNELPLARERLATLLSLEPPANVRPLLERQIEAIDRQLANPGGPAVRVNVDIAPGLHGAADRDAPLFVIVRDPAAAGPPLAVKRLAARFPQEVELTAADAMVPGRVFTTGQSVQVVARIARSGSATAARGDPFGEVHYDVGGEGAVSVVIDRLTP